MKDDKLYLIHVRESIERIEQYVRCDRDAFMGSPMIQDAVFGRNLQVLAESTQRVSETLKSGHPEVPWREIVGLRNVLVDDYLGVDLVRVWKSFRRISGN